MARLTHGGDCRAGKVSEEAGRDFERVFCGSVFAHCFSCRVPAGLSTQPRQFHTSKNCEGNPGKKPTLPWPKASESLDRLSRCRLRPGDPAMCFGVGSLEIPHPRQALTNLRSRPGNKPCQALPPRPPSRAAERGRKPMEIVFMRLDFYPRYGTWSRIPSSPTIAKPSRTTNLAAARFSFREPAALLELGGFAVLGRENPRAGAKPHAASFRRASAGLSKLFPRRPNVWPFCNQS